MKKFLLALAFVLPAALALSPPASAQKLDLSKVKCEEWLKAPKETIAITLAWLDGYYADEDADSVIDFDKIGKDAEKLATACARNLDKTIGDVAEEVLGN